MPKPFLTQYAFLGNVTAAGLAAQPGPDATAGAPACYVDEFAAWYQWTIGSVVAADGYRVISHTGGSAGRWILISDGIHLAPSRGATWVSLVAARTAMAYKGTITCAAEAWTANVAVDGVTNCPNGTHEIWEEGATINGTIALSPGTIPQNGIWYNNGGTTSPTATTTLNGNVAAGSLTFTLTNATGFDVNGWFRVMRGVAYTRTYKIVAKVGNVITLDRETRRPFNNGDTVEAISAARDITIEGNGVIVTGQADAIWQMASGVNVRFMDIDAKFTTGKFMCVFDLGSRDCTINNIISDANNAIGSAFLVANTEHITFYNCRGFRADTAGGACLFVASSDSFNDYSGYYTESDGSACELSVEDATDTFGVRASGFHGTFFGKAVGAGVLVQNSSSYNIWTGCEASDNFIGWTFTGGNGPANGNGLINCVANRNSQVALSAASATVGNRAIALSGEGNTVAFASVSGAADFEFVDPYINDTSVGAVSQGLIQSNGNSTIVRVIGGYATTARNAQHFMEVSGGTALGEIDGSFRFIGAGTNEALILIAQGVGRLSGNVRVTSAGGFGVFLNGASAYARIGEDVDLSGAGTPLQVSSGNANIGTFTLSGASPSLATVTFGDTKATDRIWMTRKTAGGTAGPQPTWVNTPGTGFALTGGNADSSIYEYRICS